MSENLPERLKRVREHLGPTVIAVTKLLELKDRKTWERYEKGETRPNSDTLGLLHDRGIDINWLLSGEGEMIRHAPAMAPVPSGAEANELDRLYDVAIAATLSWYHEAGLDAPPAAMAAMITRSVRLLRSRGDTADKTNEVLVAEIASILDVAREMLSSTGWQPR